MSFCRNETGRLLAMLAATRDGTMAEFGTGCGVGTAWLRSGVRGEKARIVTAELDRQAGRARPRRSSATTRWSRCSPPTGRRCSTRARSRCCSSTPASPSEVGVDAVADLVEDGGIVVLDDFTPCELWPPITHGRVDTLREQWLTDERFTTVEVMVAPDAVHPHRHQALSESATARAVGACRRDERRHSAGTATRPSQVGSISWVSGPMASA